MIYKKDYTFIMSQKLPEGQLGDYALKKLVLQKGELIRTYTPAGFFYFAKVNADLPVVRLTKGRDILMSDTPMEQEGLRIPTVVARGNTLIIGLGIGLLPTLIRMRNRVVQRIMIVEQSVEVAKLVYRHIKTSRTNILVCDGEEYLKTCKEKFDFIYIDVWEGIATTLTEIEKWTKLAEPCLTESGEVKCWLQELYSRVKINLKRGPAGPTAWAGFHPPCLACGKMFRNDYAGLCMDCADTLKVSEIFAGRSNA